MMWPLFGWGFGGFGLIALIILSPCSQTQRLGISLVETEQTPSLSETRYIGMDFLRSPSLL